MYDADLRIHVSGETDARRIEAARSLPDLPHDIRLTPWTNIAELLLQNAAEAASHPYLTFIDSDDSRIEFTHGEFAAAVRRVASMLWTLGARRGTRICTVATNHADTVVQYFASWLIGAVVVPVNVGEDDKRIAFILRDANVSIALVREEFVDRIETVRSELPSLEHVVRIRPVEGRMWSLSAAVERHDAEFLPDELPGPDDDALIVYTSGTTGLPKGVVLDQYNLLVDAKAISEWHGIDSEQRMMCVLPIHHVNGTVVTLVTPMLAGASVVLERKFHTHSFFQRVAAERVNIVSVVPTLLQYLAHERIDVSSLDLSAFRHVICGAGPLTCDLAARFETMYGIPIIHGYGLSETTCYSCFLPTELSGDEHSAWMTAHGFPSIGVPLPVNEMDIHTPDGASCADGVRGEIVIRGHNVMRWYYGNPAANAEAFANGWFRSGDEGFRMRDPTGRPYFFITGRIKELIIRGGVNIAPLEIDEVLGSCPGVLAGIAVGFENDWYGEEVGALVVSADPAVSEDDVLTHCRSLLPRAKAPKVVVFAQRIPVTSTGKYQRNSVKHLFLEWKSVQFH